MIFRNLEDLLVISTINKALTHSAGVYAFRNIDTGEIVYVGSSSDQFRRFSEHMRGYSSNIPLQQSFKKYGVSAFEFLVLETYQYDWDLSNLENRNLLLAIEQKYLDLLNPRYNISTVAGAPMAGLQHSEETRAKMSDAKRGENNPNYGKDFTGENNPFYGKTHSEESKARITSANSKAVYLYSLDNELLNVFSNQSQAATFLGIGQQYVSKLIKSGKVYKGKFVLKGPNEIS